MIPHNGGDIEVGSMWKSTGVPLDVSGDRSGSDPIPAQSATLSWSNLSVSTKQKELSKTIIHSSCGVAGEFFDE